MSASPELAYVPESEKVAQVFGHQPLIWAVFCLIVAFFFGIQSRTPPFDLESVVFACSFLLALGFIVYEVRRRRRRIVLVRDGASVAIYRKGRFDLAVTPDSVGLEKVWISQLLHWGPFIGASLGLLALLLTAVGLTSILRGEASATTADSLIILAAGCAFWASLASAAWTTFGCAHLLLPVKGSKWKESILVRSSRLKKVLPDLAKGSKNRRKGVRRG
jgi:hypothetical protein